MKKDTAAAITIAVFNAIDFWSSGNPSSCIRIQDYKD
jgi:hypothetical protein